MEKVKQGILPLIVGAIVGMILLSKVFGFVSSGTASDMAERAANEAVVAALVPQCVANATAAPEMLAAMKAESSYRQRSAVSDAGWSVYPEGANPSLKRAIDQGCVDALT